VLHVQSLRHVSAGEIIASRPLDTCWPNNTGMTINLFLCENAI
jgi:hypothetical protein